MFWEPGDELVKQLEAQQAVDRFSTACCSIPLPFTCGKADGS